MKPVFVYDPRAIANLWPQLCTGFELVLEYSCGEVDLNWIYNELISGRLQLWVGYEDSGIVCFFTSKVIYQVNDKPHLLIYHAFILPGVQKDVFLEGLEVIEKYAILNQCKYVCMYTVRDKAFEKKLGPQGWKRTYVEFRKEL